MTGYGENLILRVFVYLFIFFSDISFAEHREPPNNNILECASGTFVVGNIDLYRAWFYALCQGNKHTVLSK